MEDTYFGSPSKHVIPFQHNSCAIESRLKLCFPESFAARVLLVTQVPPSRYSLRPGGRSKWQWLCRRDQISWQWHLVLLRQPGVEVTGVSGNLSYFKKFFCSNQDSNKAYTLQLFDMYRKSLLSYKPTSLHSPWKLFPTVWDVSLWPYLTCSSFPCVFCKLLEFRDFQIQV